MLAPENQCSLDERHPVRRVGDAERARDGVGEMPFECYRKGIGHFLGRRYISRWLIMRTGPKLNDGGPYRNMFFASVTYNNDLTPFQGASAGWAVPRVETLG